LPYPGGDKRWASLPKSSVNPPIEVATPGKMLRRLTFEVGIPTFVVGQSRCVDAEQAKGFGISRISSGECVLLVAKRGAVPKEILNANYAHQYNFL
jgi:hypothetical protein